MSRTDRGFRCLQTGTPHRIHRVVYGASFAAPLPLTECPTEVLPKFYLRLSGMSTTWRTNANRNLSSGIVLFRPRTPSLSEGSKKGYHPGSLGETGLGVFAARHDTCVGFDPEYCHLLTSVWLQSRRLQERIISGIAALRRPQKLYPLEKQTGPRCIIVSNLH